MNLKDLTGAVEYKMFNGRTASARIASGIRIGDGSDTPVHPLGEPFKWAWNGKIHLKVTQAAIDRGDWWPVALDANLAV